MTWERQPGYEPQDRLPGEDPLAAHPGATPLDGSVVPAGAGPLDHSAGTAVARIGGTATERALTAVFGDVKRDGRWTVAGQTRVISVFGDVTLDLREATFEGGVVEVRAYTAFGDIKLIVPPGVDVQVKGMLVFGSSKVSRRTEAQPGAPVVVVTANGGFGDVKVLELNPGEREPKWYDRFR